MDKEKDRFGPLNVQLPPPLRVHRCENCEFFALAIPGRLPATCRINPVLMLAGGPGQVVGLFPPTEPAYWCGKWQPVTSDAVATLS